MPSASDIPFNASTKFIDTPNNTTTYAVHGLMPATTYTVFLSAFTGAGEGNNSTSVMNDTLPGNVHKYCDYHMSIYRNSLTQKFHNYNILLISKTQCIYQAALVRTDLSNSS